ncbi:MAG: cysteine--tRNA ligase [Alphaproteobacteria bacterium]|nr:cysteine--tRNA ligase [Alphaproteobacteria bacterium]
MTIQLYNTAARAKQDFTPIDPANVRMYVCGPTVYDFAHIGNARPVIVFDVLYRLLRHTYGIDHVTYVRNITDVDDKINARAARDFPGMELNAAIRQVTEKTANQYVADVTELGCLPPSVTPRATEHLAEMILLNQRLIEKGHAYVAEGHVLFHVPSMPDYGKLSGRSIDDMIAGARVDVAPYKRDPMDFVLWKPSDEGMPGWDSPWGRGRPGWHIECSAMAWKHLGEVFDIHGGGIDLAFPHHENELAQSRCAHGTPVMANIWMHNGFLNVEGEKMSKSLGNFFTIRELLDQYRGENLRLQMLSSHYRQPTNWTEAGANEARTVMRGWYEAVAKVEDEAPVAPPGAVVAAVSDDLNSPEAIAELHRLRSAAGKSKDAARALRAGGLLLGFFGQTAEQYRSWMPAKLPITAEEIEALIAARAEARKSKNFAEADRVRDRLLDAGLTVEDSAAGTTWRAL